MGDHQGEGEVVNIHVTDLTPTQRACIERSQNFRASIAARAAELEHRKVNAALEALCVVAREAPLSQTPLIQSAEAMPADAEPSPNWFVVVEPKHGDFPSIRDIQRKVCEHYGVTLIDILSRRRTADIVRPRQLAMYLCKKFTLHSLPQIGRRFGGKDHTTVLHSVQKMEHLCPRDAALAHDIAILTETITGVQQ
jgi:chromosomal replication initiation ATPase DnaA